MLHGLMSMLYLDVLDLGPVAQSLVSANRLLRCINTYRFPWYLTLAIGGNHASSNAGLDYIIVVIGLNDQMNSKKLKVIKSDQMNGLKRCHGIINKRYIE